MNPSSGIPSCRWANTPAQSIIKNVEFKICNDVIKNCDECKLLLADCVCLNKK